MLFWTRRFQTAKPRDKARHFAPPGAGDTMPSMNCVCSDNQRPLRALVRLPWFSVVLRRLMIVACLLLPLLIAAGCRPATNSPQDATENPPAAIEQQDEQPAEVTLRQADAAAFAELLKSKQGQVVLVDCWATWCVACRQQFPHTVELHREFAAQGLAVISVSFDDPTDEAAVSDAQAFLTHQKATFDNLVNSLGAAEGAFEAFGIDNGALPHYQLYDRRGQLVRKFNSGDPHAPPFTPEDIRQAIVAQLAQADSAAAPNPAAP